MSIIYDALKKAEKTINNIDTKVKENKEDKQTKTKLYLLYILVVSLGLFIANIVFGFLSYPKSSPRTYSKQISATKKADANTPQEPPKQVSPRPQEVAPAVPPSTVSRYRERQSKGSLVLNGVFFSENEGYALINNKIVKVGDVVSGATVKRISIDEVELEVAGSTVKLTTQQR